MNAKTFLFLLSSQLAVLAQTNYVMAADWTNLISFTNSSGILVSNARPVRVDHSKLIYLMPGGGGTVKLSDLPFELQQRFGYNPDIAAADEQAEKDRHLRDLQRQAQEETAYEPVPPTALRSRADFRSHPVRSLHGKIYDFTGAIAWLSSRPGDTSPYPSTSPLSRDWELQKQRSEAEGQRWKQYLVEGTIREGRADGLIIDVPITLSVESGAARQGRISYPVYSTIHTTKQILLRNAPNNLSLLPVFAIPIGSVAVGTASLEAFDYGTPVQPIGTARPVVGAVRSDPQGYKDGVPINIYNSIAAEAESRWPGNYVMQEFVIKEQVEAYKKLHP